MKVFFSTTFFLGIISAMWGVILARETFVDNKILILIGIFSTLIGFIFIVKAYRNTYNNGAKTFFAFCQSGSMFGLTIPTLLLAVNSSSEVKEQSWEKFEISERGSFGAPYRNGSTSRFSIIRDNGKKDISFPLRYYQTRDEYQFVNLIIVRGKLGLDFIADKRLEKYDQFKHEDLELTFLLNNRIKKKVRNPESIDITLLTLNLDLNADIEFRMTKQNGNYIKIVRQNDQSLCFYKDGKSIYKAAEPIRTREEIDFILFSYLRNKLGYKLSHTFQEVTSHSMLQ